MGDVRVFVSSTYQDLIDYRAAVTRAVLTGENIADDMLYWPAEEDRALDASLRRVRASDLVVLILAHRYGTVPPAAEASITELEFREALACSIPVLAFTVDPSHEWPPPFIDVDPDTRLRLQRFRDEVGQRVVTKAFTSPESLEVAVAHGLSRFRDRRSRHGESDHARRRARPVSRSESVCYSPDGLIRIGRAPDGAPLLLDIHRRIPVAEELRRIAASLERKPDDPFIAEIRGRIEKEARLLAVTRNIVRVADGGDVYVTPRPLVDLVAPGLFQSALTGEVPRPRPSYERAPYDRPEYPRDRSRLGMATTEVGLRLSSDANVPIVSMGGDNRFLCVRLDRESRVWSGGWTPGGPGGRRLAVWREYREEGLERLAPVRYVLDRGEYGGAEPLLVTDSAERFHARWLKAYEQENNEDLAALTGSVFVSRRALMSFVLGVIDEVAALHRAGRLHGDIKPSNILAARDGDALIDEVPDLHVGEVSPTVTVSWSPPEQLLRRPLNPAADVYPLGALLLHALAGEALGRVVDYRMPGDVTAEVVDDPTVYLRPDHDIVPAERQDAWCDLIEKALRTDPAARWRDAGELGGAVRSAMAGCSIDGWIEVGYPWGSRPALVREEDGRLATAWIVADR